MSPCARTASARPFLDGPRRRALHETTDDDESLDPRQRGHSRTDDGRRSMKPSTLLLVGAGGFLGAISRYLVATLFAMRVSTAWPWGTFVINMSGCFAIGFFMTLTVERIVVIHESWRYLFAVGFVGAYTTFSTYEYETVQLVQEGHWLRALSYVVASTVVGFAAVLSAVALARRL
jgi:CrcB protein